MLDITDCKPLPTRNKIIKGGFQVKNSDVKEVFEYWNSKGIIVHKELTDELLKIINRRLLKTSKTDILIAIDRYDEIIRSDYYFSYKWRLKDFMFSIRGHIEKFLDDGEHWANFCQWKDKDNKPVKVIQPQLPIINKITDNGIYDNCLRYLKSMQYNEYLETEHWKHFKGEVIKWAGCKCQLCNKDNLILDVHHKTYTNRGRETFNDVIVLCNDCHAIVHNKLPN